MPDDGPARRTGAVVPLGRVLGVPVQLSPSWFLFAALVVATYGPELARDGNSARGYAAAASFALLLLASVLLHEVGHCVAARAFGLRVRRITVSFLAGLTEISDPPATPGRAFAVSVAGPAVSAALCGLGLAAAQLLQAGTARNVVVLMAVSNAGLAIFNLLPGLPLDGGGALRAVIWKATGQASSGTVVAAYAGRVLAVAVVPLVLAAAPLIGAQFSTVGIVTSALVAAFLWAGATAALRSARVERRLGGLAATAIARPALLVSGDMPLAEALRRAHEARLHAIVVVDAHGAPRAVVSEAAVIAVPEQRRPWVSVGELARTLHDGLILDPALSGEALVDAVRRSPASEYVVRGPQPRVLVTADLERLAGGAPAVA